MRLNDYINYPWDISGLKPGDIVYTIEFYDDEVHTVSRAKVMSIDKHYIYLNKYNNFFDIVFFLKTKNILQAKFSRSGALINILLFVFL